MLVRKVRAQSQEDCEIPGMKSCFKRIVTDAQVSRRTSVIKLSIKEKGKTGRKKEKRNVAPDGIRTRSLRLRRPTRCHYATRANAFRLLFTRLLLLEVLIRHRMSFETCLIGLNEDTLRGTGNLISSLHPYFLTFRSLQSSFRTSMTHDESG